MGRTSIIVAVAMMALVVPSVAGAATTTQTLVARGSTWRYLGNGTDPGTGWRNPGFNDTSWKSGPAQLGYGDGDEKTVVGYGPDANRKYKTTYFRAAFNVTSPGSLTGLRLGILRDDGAAVYINGTEVARSNMPAGTLGYLTDAAAAATSETTYFTYDLPTSVLRAGTNTVAVEVHQKGWSSSDISMDLELVAMLGAGTGATSTGCTALGGATTLGRIGNPAVRESSGLAVGVRSPGVLYTHNDSGDTARFFALGIDGRPLGTFALAGAGAVDWEDMGVGPGPAAGQSYLYLGDIGGGNFAVVPRTTVTVYRVPEPAVAAGAATTATTTLTGVTRFDLTYPGGASHDAETLLVDPVSGNVHIVTKQVSGVSHVFRFTPGATSGAPPLTEVGILAIPGPGDLQATGGSVSRDGSVVVIRTYDRAFRWRRTPGSTLAATLAGAPCIDLWASQPQGEAVALGADGRSMLVTSEGSSSAILSYVIP